jgi:hypothetical protein
MGSVGAFLDFIGDGSGGLLATQTGSVAGHGLAGWRVVRLDASFDPVAAAWVLPGAELPIIWTGTPIVIDGKVVTPTLRAQLDGPHLAVDAQGRIWMQSGALAATSQALARFYGQTLELRDANDLFLVKLSPALAVEQVVSLPADGAQMFGLIAAAPDGTIGVAALSQTTTPVEANKSFVYDVFVASVDGDGRALGERVLDLGGDDHAYGLAACGRAFCVSGETGTKWVDTGSQVAFATGFVAALEREGSAERHWTLHGPRQNVVQTTAPRGDGSVVFAGVTDGYITHTPESERYATTVLGLVPGL